MRYAMPLTALLLTLPLCAACAGSIQVAMPAAGCSSLIPAKWADPVPSAAFPQDDAEERDWQVFGVEQTGQLAKANGRSSDVIAVVKACEARDQAAVRQIERQWWRRLLPG